MMALVSFVPLPEEHTAQTKAEEHVGQQCDEKGPPSLVRTVFCYVGGFVDVYHDDISAVSTVIIAIFTAILGYFTISLSNSTRIAANAAEKALNELERPWIFLEVVNIRIRHADHPNGWAVVLHWRNVGRSPAIIDDCVFDLVAKKLMVESSDYSRCINHFQCKKTVSAGDGFVTTESGPDPAQLPSLTGVNLIIYGKLSYQGLSRVHYTSGFAIEISIDGSSFTTFGGDAYNYYT